MDRRDFLGLAAGLLACQGDANSRNGPDPLRLAPRKLDRIGIQLYSVRDDAKKDMEGTLAQLARMGYRTIELLDSFDNFGVAPAPLRAMLDRTGLRATSTHADSKFITTDIEANLDRVKVLGHEYVIIAELPRSQAKTLDDYRMWAERINTSAELARKAGVWLGFHNHMQDFTPIGGQVPYDVLIERIDPALVRMQLDVGNLAAVNLDPLDYLRRHGSRYWSFHIKDVVRPPATGFAELGKGRLDFKRILAAIERISEKEIFVEQENYEVSPLEHARNDIMYLSALEF
jgi:sugar phosphate isomerase/epimerase